MKIEPQQFMKEFLNKQMNGLTGHIEVAGFPFGKVEWGQPDVYANDGKPNWWVYEQTAYWLDGYTRAAILLNDKKALDKAKSIIYNVLLNDDGGYVGPKQLKAAVGEDDRWPHVVFFRACMAFYEYCKDEKIIKIMARHYIDCPVDFARGRNVLNVEIMCWLYGKTGDVKLLALAEKSYEEYNKKCDNDLCDKVAISAKKPRSHGVGYNEYSKLGAILYLYTKKEAYLKASVCAYKKIDKFFMLPDGLHSSSEFMISNNIMESHETCCVTDYTWSLNYLYEATKNTDYLDKIEKCVFNAGLGAVTNDFKALQYLSCVNQVILDNHSNHNLYFKGEKWMTYRPRPAVACCTGNVNRFMPNYIMNMISASEKEIFVKLYGAADFEINGIAIKERTNYPFDENIVFDIKTQRTFTLSLRIPKWCKNFIVLKNGTSCDYKKGKGYISLSISCDCSIELIVKSDVLRHFKDNGVWFTKGAVLYTLNVPAKWKEDAADENTNADFKAWEIYPDGKWNYGIADKAEVRLENDGSILVEAFEVNNWKLLKRKSVKRCILQDKEFEIAKGDFVFTPPIPAKSEHDEKTEVIKLTPYGFSKCRITVFPRIR